MALLFLCFVRTKPDWWCGSPSSHCFLEGCSLAQPNQRTMFHRFSFKKQYTNFSNPTGKKCIYIHVYIYIYYFFQIIYTHPFFGYFQFATLYFCRLFVLQIDCERIDCFWPGFSRVPLARLTKWSFELVLSKSFKINIFENRRVLMCKYLKSNKLLISWIVQISYYIEVPDRQQHQSHNP